jgi:hypothetical protein
VHGTQSPRRGGADEEPFLLWHVQQRELVGIEESRRDRAPQPLGVLRIALLGDDEIAAKH